MEIKITKSTQPKAKPDETKLGFGKIFTDHILLVDYNREKGWHNAQIKQFEYLSIHPASTVLHYGSEIFEGMKAYRTSDGTVQLFRPIENARRLNVSAERLGLPQMDENYCVELIKTLVEVDCDWVPRLSGTSLYIRPFMFGNDETLGVHPVLAAKFVVIMSPVGAYYAEGLNPVKICIETQDVRAVRGGTGYAKCGGNYASSVRASAKAEAKGYSQVLWLDGVERKYIEEVGAMNVMFKINNEIITPALSGSILSGITRKSAIELMRDWGFTVTERLFSIDELIEAVQNGSLTEAWGTGTAAVVSPIGFLSINGVEYKINNNKIGEVTQRLYDELTSIQWGGIQDKKGWTVKVCK